MKFSWQLKTCSQKQEDVAAETQQQAESGIIS